MMRPHRFSQFGTNHDARALCGRSTCEQHNATSGILERRLQKTNSNRKRNARTPERSTVAGHGPRIFLQLLESLCKLEFGPRDGQQESSGWAHGHGWALLLGWYPWPHRGLSESQHFLDLLCTVILASTKNEGLCALSVSDLVHLGLQTCQFSLKNSVVSNADLPWSRM